EDLADFSVRHERIKVELEERPSNGVVQGLLDGIADLGICSSDCDTRGLHTVRYRRDQLVLVVRSGHPLAEAHQVAFSDTLDNDFV
ncbi:LysR substrate-binding domain-containing protein, partial [Klebsiella pneumoniae]|nr:LysR substrate-binding domain-containing protein [Klebsiella pneumoniae]